MWDVTSVPQLELPAVKLAQAHEDGQDANAQGTIQVPKQEYIGLKWQANYYRAQHARAVAREAALKKKIETWKAKVRDLTQRLYGKKSEQSKSTKNKDKPKASRPRGHQKGSPGHGRIDRSHLPVVAEVKDLAPEDKHCGICGKEFVAFEQTADSQIVEVHVQAHIRKIKRRRYAKSCQCQATPAIITAPPAPRLIAKSSLGVSVWTTVLLNKFLYWQPTYRLCQELAHQGLPIAPGTLTDGLKKLKGLFEPLHASLYEMQMSEDGFHADETRWQVFEEIPGKVGHRWYLWITQSASVVYYVMAPGRGADVPKAHFGGLPKELKQVILVCDRYSSYKCLADKIKVILLAFCWVHARRDFLDAARAWPRLADWMFSWVEDIRRLYHLNARRLEFWQPDKTLGQQSPLFALRHEQLGQKLKQMEQRREALLKDEKQLNLAQLKVLKSLKNHWSGLTVFFDHPQVPMDNNRAERGLRGAVTGRKNFYGSGSVWSAHLAAMMFTVLQTVMLWKLNPRHWLGAFLQACAENGGQSPADLSAFLPWRMSPDRKNQLAAAPPPPRQPEIIDTS